jgi:hypothetical protein
MAGQGLGIIAAIGVAVAGIGYFIIKYILGKQTQNPPTPDPEPEDPTEPDVPVDPPVVPPVIPPEPEKPSNVIPSYTSIVAVEKQGNGDYLCKFMVATQPEYPIGLLRSQASDDDKALIDQYIRNHPYIPPVTPPVNPPTVITDYQAPGSGNMGSRTITILKNGTAFGDATSSIAGVWIQGYNAFIDLNRYRGFIRVKAVDSGHTNCNVGILGGHGCASAKWDANDGEIRLAGGWDAKTWYEKAKAGTEGDSVNWSFKEIYVPPPPPSKVCTPKPSCQTGYKAVSYDGGCTWQCVACPSGDTSTECNFHTGGR